MLTWLLTLAVAAATGALGHAGPEGPVVTYHDDVTLLADTTRVFDLPPSASKIAVAVRGRLRGRHWSLVWGSWPDAYYSATITPRPAAAGDLAPHDAFAVDIMECSALQPVAPVASITAEEEVDPTQPNTLQAVIDPATGLTELFLGTGAPLLVYSGTLDYRRTPVSNWGIAVKGRLEVDVAATGVTEPSLLETTRVCDADSLLEALSAPGRDPLEGCWKYLDRDSDPELARPGGRYRLAVVSTGPGEYDIVYLSGAEVCAPRWHPGMVRGRLRATRFADSYDLEWIDAEGRALTRDVHATVEQGSILSLCFPLYHTTLRFAKEP